MSYQNLVSIRTYLTNPEFDEANVALRARNIRLNGAYNDKISFHDAPHQ